MSPETSVSPFYTPQPHFSPVFMATLVGTMYYPTNNALLISFRVSSDAEIFVNKHRLSMQIIAPNVQKRACNVYIFRLSFHLAYHRWWLGSPRDCIEEKATFFLLQNMLSKKHKMFFLLWCAGVREIVCFSQFATEESPRGYCGQTFP